MIGFYIAIGAAAAAAAIREEEEFFRLLDGLPAETRQRLIEARERARQEAAVERRHRELCAAIRSTSFWRFGS